MSALAGTYTEAVDSTAGIKTSFSIDMSWNSISEERYSQKKLSTILTESDMTTARRI